MTALPALAQEKPPVPPERLPPPLDVKPSVAAPSCEAQATFPPCESPRVVWMEYEVPIRRLVPREIITEERRPTQEVAYRTENRVVKEIVIKSREVEKETPCTVMREVATTDCNGNCVNMMKSFTELRKVKELEFFSAPEERTIAIQVPYLKPAEIVVPQRHIILEYRVIMQKKSVPVRVAGAAAKPDRWAVAPEPPCDEEIMTSTPPITERRERPAEIKEPNGK